MKTPYEELGVSTDADAEQIKAAFRRRARETHPDQGGDREEFQRVQAAYEVLSDPKKRAHYDATGSAGVAPGDVPTAVEMLLRAFGEAIDHEEPGFGQFSNPLRRTEKLLAVSAAEIRHDLSQARAEHRRLTRLQKRLVRRNGEALLESLLESRIMPIERHIARAEAFLQRIEETLRLLDGYDFAAAGEEDATRALPPRKKPRARKKAVAGAGL